MENLTPLAAIRRECAKRCMTGGLKEVKNCSVEECAIWKYRMGKMPEGKVLHRPLAAIREYCLACAGSPEWVRTCSGRYDDKRECSLHSFRLGKNQAYAGRKPPAGGERTRFRAGHGRKALIPRTEQL